MGMLDKLMFWKKDDDFDFKSLSNDPLGSTPLHENIGLENDPFGQDSLATKTQNTPPTQPQAPPPMDDLKPEAFGQAKQASGTRDLELISSKLDTIKALLQSLDSRVTNIERIAKQEEVQQRQEQQNKQNHKLW